MIRRGALLAVDSGGGKDSQCMTILLSSIVPREQMVVVHTPLAEVEWPGTIEHIDNTLPDGVPLIRRGRLESSRRRPFDDPSRPPCRACYLPRNVPPFCRANRRTAHTPSTPKISRPILSPEFILRVRPETLCRITEFSEHESNGRELDEGERVAVEVLPVLGQSAAAVEPGDGAFDHPTPGLDDEALHPIGSLDDLGLEIGQDAGQGAVKDRALIGAVGEQFPEKGKQTEQGRQQRETAVAILNVGGGDDAVQQQALRIDQNMPLLALDQLAGIEAVAVDASPPFSALFTL